jgi:hypothetical protein
MQIFSASCTEFLLLGQNPASCKHTDTECYNSLLMVCSFFRFYKLLWGAYGLDHSDDNPLSGLLLGGAEQGQLYVWDTAKIIS